MKIHKSKNSKWIKNGQTTAKKYPVLEKQQISKNNVINSYDFIERLNKYTRNGDVVCTEIDEKDSQLRVNFNEAYNTDYLDGDVQSNPNGDADEMYKFAVDEKGDQIKEQEKVKSLVSDQTRVVKGGSWKDSAYWLDPAQSR